MDLTIDNDMFYIKKKHFAYHAALVRYMVGKYPS